MHSWHPGNFVHQLKSRFYVYNVIKVLREALIEWKNSENFVLPDEAWHVTESFQKIRDAVVADGADSADCFKSGLPDIVCQIPFNSRSEYTPRANPRQTSIRSILHADVDVPDVEPNVYDPPDVYNPAMDPPDGHVDFVAIMESGNDFQPLPMRRKYLTNQIQPPSMERVAAEKRVSGLPPGKGWDLIVNPAADNCDGTYDSFCNRGAHSACLLYAHNDGRGNLQGDGLSGWLHMTLKDVRHGAIIIKLENQGGFANKRTLGWKCENNADTCDNPMSEEDANRIKVLGKQEKPCTDYTFEFAIDGEITKWSDEEFSQKLIKFQRVVQLYVLKNDPSFVPEGQTKDVEVSIRIGGNCGRSRTWGFSHIYWA